FRIARYVLRGLEYAEGARALRVRLALGHLFAVEVRHLLDEVHVVQQDRAVRPDRQRVAVARSGRAGARRRITHVGWLLHPRPPSGPSVHAARSVSQDPPVSRSAEAPVTNAGSR